MDVIVTDGPAWTSVVSSRFVGSLGELVVCTWEFAKSRVQGVWERGGTGMGQEEAAAIRMLLRLRLYLQDYEYKQYGYLVFRLLVLKKKEKKRKDFMILQPLAWNKQRTCKFFFARLVDWSNG